jgi:2-haloacid dehalogenase
VSPQPLADISACVFDAYGTLFDLTSAARRCRDALGDKADAMTRSGGQSSSNGRRAAILSNGSPRMLEAAVASAGIGGLLEHVLSIEGAGVYKPDRRVYELASRRLGLAAERICFVSSNGWDAVGAASFGFKAVWANRIGAPRERLPAQPVAVVDSLAALPALLGL